MLVFYDKYNIYLVVTHWSWCVVCGESPWWSKKHCVGSVRCLPPEGEWEANDFLCSLVSLFIYFFPKGEKKCLEHTANWFLWKGSFLLQINKRPAIQYLTCYFRSIRRKCECCCAFLVLSFLVRSTALWRSTRSAQSHHWCRCMSVSVQYLTSTWGQQSFSLLYWCWVTGR